MNTKAQIDKTKAQVYVIMEQVKKGTLTKEEADKKLVELGVELPKHHGKVGQSRDLNEKTKEHRTSYVQT